MHIAFVCPELHGHMNPMTTLARELVRRGHRATVFGSPTARPKAEACGLGFAPVGVPEYEAGTETAGLARLAELKGVAALRLTGRLLRDQAAVALRDLPAAFRRAGVEAAVVDQITPAGVAVADSLRLPQVVVCNALALNQEAGVPPGVLGWAYRDTWLARLRNRLGNLLLKVAARPIRRTVNEYRVGHGLPRYTIGSPADGLAHVAQQPAFFDYPRTELPPHFHYTGPWHGPARDTEDTPFPWERLDGRPVVYASLGTLQNRLQHVFRAILDGCAGLPVQVVLALGRTDAVWDQPVPANAVVVPFAPQLKVLDRAGLLVTHAGLNTALEGLARGLPMLCLPVTNDQPGVARRVEWLGAGEVLKPGRATAERVRALVERLLKDGRYRAAAEKCRDLLTGNPGVARAADIVEQAFRTGKRVER